MAGRTRCQPVSLRTWTNARLPSFLTGGCTSTCEITTTATTPMGHHVTVAHMLSPLMAGPRSVREPSTLHWSPPCAKRRYRQPARISFLPILQTRTVANRALSKSQSTWARPGLASLRLPLKVFPPVKVAVTTTVALCPGRSTMTLPKEAYCGPTIPRPAEATDTAQQPVAGLPFSHGSRLTSEENIGSVSLRATLVFRPIATAVTVR
mmetsp:Transcript_7943/g.20374  ORF Transcript_7943/g.20374 Transcript_7943/m.20374 type:complete len:208 (-) Transcript_7943:12-635(-)